MTSTTCFICRKHLGEIRIPGGPIFSDDLLYAGHAALSEGETDAFLGTILLEPKRHVAGFAELDGEEAARFGRMLRRISQAIQACTAAEHIYVFTLGHHVDHLHLWLVPRYPGTPREYWGIQAEEWPDAPRGDAKAVEQLCQNLRDFLAD